MMHDISFALESVDVTCIHGPPGEGTWKPLCIPALMHVQVQEKPTRSDIKRKLPITSGQLGRYPYPAQFVDLRKS